MIPYESVDDLAKRLKPHYSLFLKHLGQDILMTAHSHQAWPNASREGHMKAWDDAAKLIDGKWDRVFSEILPKFQAHIAKRIGSNRPQDIAVAPNTHELVYRLLSCFKPSPTVLTSSSEFHSLRRQLTRLVEEGATVTAIDSQSATFSEQFCNAIKTQKPDLIALSYVFFTNAQIVTDISRILKCADEQSCPVLIDLYHAFNTVELDVSTWPGQCFAVGGGYKYAQSGEGVCWMLLPEDSSTYRPRNTGWFADFEHLDSPSRTIDYGEGGQRFLGATFDPTSLYRANAVMDWMDVFGLSVKTLREQASTQTQIMIDAFADLRLRDQGYTLASPQSASKRASFVSLRHPDATQRCKELAHAGLRTDARGELLRLGPGPYITSSECLMAMEMIQRRAV